MFRKLILSAGAVATTLSGFASSSADAHPIIVIHPPVIVRPPVICPPVIVRPPIVISPPIVVAPPIVVCRDRFEVRIRCGLGWENRGLYREMCDAERAAEHLRHEGFQVEIREL